MSLYWTTILFTVLSSPARWVYPALSYAWGDPTQSHHIHVRSTRLSINVNLNAALGRLRQSGASRHTWVDAVCIYQDRHRTKYCRNLRFEPLFREGVGSAHLASLSSIHTHELVWAS